MPSANRRLVRSLGDMHMNTRAKMPKKVARQAPRNKSPKVPSRGPSDCHSPATLERCRRSIALNKTS